MLVELGRANFHFPDLERFNFLLNIYHAAGKFSAFSMKILLDWSDFTARYSAVRILIRVPKEIYDVLEQSENLVLHTSHFAQSSPLVREKAAYLAQQNLNSLDLGHAFYHLSQTTEELQAIAFLRDEFRNNVELLTLAGLLLPVSFPILIVSDCLGTLDRNNRNVPFRWFPIFFSSPGRAPTILYTSPPAQPQLCHKTFPTILQRRPADNLPHL